MYIVIGTHIISCLWGSLHCRYIRFFTYVTYIFRSNIMSRNHFRRSVQNIFHTDTNITAILQALFLLQSNTSICQVYFYILTIVPTYTFAFLLSWAVTFQTIGSDIDSVGIRDWTERAQNEHEHKTKNVRYIRKAFLKKKKISNSLIGRISINRFLKWLLRVQSNWFIN